MHSPAQQQITFQWRPDWRTSVFTGLLLPLLVGLGFWQLQRATEKEQLTRVWGERQVQLPQRLPDAQTAAAELAYLRVELRGEFLQDRFFLLDNRLRGGRYGLELLVPLRVAGSGQLVLVNRGWVPGDPSRRQLPQVKTPTGMQQLRGTIYVPPGVPYTLGPERDTGSWPRLLMAMDMAAVTQMLGEPAYPYSVRLEAGTPAALEAEWPFLNSTPDKHRAYALQWFSMALALLCLYLVRSSNLLQRLGWWRGDGGD